MVRGLRFKDHYPKLAVPTFPRFSFEMLRVQMPLSQTTLSSQTFGASGTDPWLVRARLRSTSIESAPEP